MKTRKGSEESNRRTRKDAVEGLTPEQVRQHTIEQMTYSSDENEDLEQYQKKQLERCEKAVAANNMAAELHALLLCRTLQIPLPEWLFFRLALRIKQAVRYRVPTGKGERRWATQHQHDLQDYLSFCVMQLIRKTRMYGTGDDAIQSAVRILSSNHPGPEWSWTFDSVRNGYLRVRRNGEDNPRYYFPIDLSLLE